MKSFYLILFIPLWIGCASVKNLTIYNGDVDIPIQFAIKDFMLTHNKEFRKDSVFYVNAKNLNSKILGVGILGTYDKVVVITEDRVHYSFQALPTGYYEKEGHFFYWHDSTKTVNVTDDLISKLRRYNILDTMIINAYIPESTIEHTKKGTDYYFCKSNLLKFKKVRTSKALGFYKSPKIRCKCNERI